MIDVYIPPLQILVDTKLMIEPKLEESSMTTGLSDIREAIIQLTIDLELITTVPRKKDSIEKIKLEKLAFANKKQKLMNDPNFKGKYVAVLERDVIDSDLDFQKLAKRVYKKFGYIPILIEKIDEEIVYGTSPHLE